MCGRCASLSQLHKLCSPCPRPRSARQQPLAPAEQVGGKEHADDKPQRRFTRLLADNTGEPFRHLAPVGGGSTAVAATAAGAFSVGGRSDEQRAEEEAGWHLQPGGQQQQHPYQATIELLMEEAAITVDR